MAVAAVAEEQLEFAIKDKPALQPGQWWLELPGGSLTSAHKAEVQRALDRELYRYQQYRQQQVNDARQSYTVLRDTGGDPSAVRALERAWNAARSEYEYATHMHYDHIQMWSEIGSDWIVSKGKYAGTLPKRVASFIRRRRYFGATGTEHMIFPATDYSAGTVAALSAVGATIGPQVNHGTRYVCDTVPHMLWNAGEFGDSGSCFWGSNELARHIFTRMGAEGRFVAVRFFDPRNTARGIGRVLCNYVRLDDGSFAWVLTNAYGVALLTAARVVATALGLGYFQHGCVNEGSTGGTVYINSGMCFVLHTLDHKPRLSSNVVELGLRYTDADESAMRKERRERERARRARRCANCDEQTERCEGCGDCVACECHCDGYGNYDDEDEDDDEDAGGDE